MSLSLIRTKEHTQTYCGRWICFQVSTHGYSQNQILVWKYPSLTQVAKLTGHSYRVLYLVRSWGGVEPDYPLFAVLNS